MSRNLPKPFFGTPPLNYNVTYMDNIVRSFALYIDQMQKPRRRKKLNSSIY